MKWPAAGRAQLVLLSDRTKKAREGARKQLPQKAHGRPIKCGCTSPRGQQGVIKAQLLGGGYPFSDNYAQHWEAYAALAMAADSILAACFDKGGVLANLVCSIYFEHGPASWPRRAGRAGTYQLRRQQ